MSTDITPFRSDCEHVLQKLPVIDMTLRFTCTQCGGIRDITVDGIRDFGSYEALINAMLAELGGTIANERTEPRPWEYPVGCIPKDETLQHLRDADIAFIDYLDAWIDKGLADGTLTVAKGARYREAIAELGEVPHVREHIAALQLKAGDVLAIIAPFDNVTLMRQMGEDVTRLLKYVGADGVDVAVFPPGTEFRILEGAAAEVSDKIRQFVEDATTQTSNSLLEELQKVRAGVMTADRFRSMLADEVRLNAAMGRTNL